MGQTYPESVVVYFPGRHPEMNVNFASLHRLITYSLVSFSNSYAKIISDASFLSEALGGYIGFLRVWDSAKKSCNISTAEGL